MLKLIWLDKTSIHLPKSHGSSVGARTGRRTIRRSKAKERLVSSSEQAHINDASTQE